MHCKDPLWRCVGVDSISDSFLLAQPLRLSAIEREKDVGKRKKSDFWCSKRAFLSGFEI
jgi:hypothetical protein